MTIVLLSSISYGQACKGEIKVEKDKFTGKISETTPSIKNISFARNIENSDTSYFLYLATLGRSTVSTPRGAYILFDDGSTLKYEDQPVVSDYIGSGMSGFVVEIRLEKGEVEEFIHKRVTDIKIHIFEVSIKEKEGRKIMCYAESISR